MDIDRFAPDVPRYYVIVATQKGHMKTVEVTINLDAWKIAKGVNDIVGTEEESQTTVTNWLRDNESTLSELLHEAVIETIAEVYED